MFKKIRILVLLYVLLLVAGGSWLSRERSTDWETPLWVVVHPIAGSAQAHTQRHVQRLDDGAFRDIEAFMAREGKRYGLALAHPVAVKLGARLAEQPPAPPRTGNVLAIMWWSLRLRYWSWQVGREHPDPPADIRMYVVFHDPQSTARVNDSLGLSKGMIGVVHAYATERAGPRNAVVIAHEMLHTLGATDKYDPSTNLPLYPQGYAEPGRIPRHPQPRAELMAGRVALSATHAETPSSLKAVVIGAETAIEIRWR